MRADCFADDGRHYRGLAPFRIVLDFRVRGVRIRGGTLETESCSLLLNRSIRISLWK